MVAPGDAIDPYGEEIDNAKGGGGLFKGYVMQRDKNISRRNGDSGERLDTMEGYNDLYDDEDDEDEDGGIREQM